MTHKYYTAEDFKPKFFKQADAQMYQDSLQTLDCDRMRHFLSYFHAISATSFDMSVDVRHTDRSLCVFQDDNQKPPEGCRVNLFGAFAFYLGAWINPTVVTNRWYYPLGFLEKMKFEDNTAPQIMFNDYFDLSPNFTSFIANCFWHQYMKHVDKVPVSDVYVFLSEVVRAAHALQIEAAA